MEDESIFINKQYKGISEGLQNFIDSMVEEIVLEGKPFDSQKKYLKKFSENEGLDYDKLEADITTFIEILDSLRTAFSNLQVKLAEEKGKDCHISEDTIQKLVKHTSQPHQKEREKALTDKKDGTGKGGSLNKSFLFSSIVLFLFVAILFFTWKSNHNNSEDENEGTSVEKKFDSLIKDIDKTTVPKVIEFQTREILMGEERDNTTLDISVDFPIKGNDDLLFAIREFINKTLSSELGIELYSGDISDGCKMIEYYYNDVASNPNNEMEVEYEIVCETSKMVTVQYIIDLSEYGGGHVTDTFGGATFRKSDGLRIDWGMFMNDDNMQAQIKKGMENYFGAGNYHLDYTPFPKGSPILLDDAVKFVYQRYELGTSYQEGLPFFSIPYSNIKNQMKSTVRELIEE